MSGKWDLFVFAGEVSGDIHGEGLLKKIKEQKPEVKIFGVAGPKMRAVGLDCFMPMEKFQVMGFIDVFLALPRLMVQFYKIRNAILKENPKGVVGIDYPGFNLRLAKSLRKKGYSGKICQYISPTVWIWGKKRIQILENNHDLLLVILPFEKEYFKDANLRVEYVGHPLMERIATHSYKTVPGLDAGIPIGLFPGSRKKEVERTLPLYLEVAKKLLEKNKDYIFPISLAHIRFEPFINGLIEEKKLPKEKFFLVPFEERYDCMKKLQCAIAKSGTVTLELALHRVPTVVTYPVSKLDYIIIRKILKIILPHYCIVNILCKKEVFPECIGPQFTFDEVYRSTCGFIDSKDLSSLQREFDRLHSLLENKIASDQAARSVLSFL